MNRLVSLSGGLGSFMTAQLVIEAYGTKDTRLLFLDTKTEDEDLYRFLDDSEKFFGVKIERVADGRNIWEVFNDVSFMGNSRIDPCSRILKRELARKWVDKNFKPEDTIMYVGIGWNESHRLERIQENWKPYKVEAPLIDKLFEPKDILKFLESVNIKPPRLYAMGFPHNNCGGFCIKTGQAQFKMLYEKFPERYKWHEEEQEKLFERIGQHGFIRMTIDKVTKYLSLKQFREHLTAKKPIDQLEFGGCGCFV